MSNPNPNPNPNLKPNPLPRHNSNPFAAFASSIRARISRRPGVGGDGPRDGGDAEAALHSDDNGDLGSAAEVKSTTPKAVSVSAQVPAAERPHDSNPSNNHRLHHRGQGHHNHCHTHDNDSDGRGEFRKDPFVDAYVPVDPFRPSIITSLRNLFGPHNDTADVIELIHVPPPSLSYRPDSGMADVPRMDMHRWGEGDDHWANDLGGNDNGWGGADDDDGWGGGNQWGALKGRYLPSAREDVPPSAVWIRAQAPGGSNPSGRTTLHRKSSLGLFGPRTPPADEPQTLHQKSSPGLFGPRTPPPADEPQARPAWRMVRSPQKSSQHGHSWATWQPTPSPPPIQVQLSNPPSSLYLYSTDSHKSVHESMIDHLPQLPQHQSSAHPPENFRQTGDYVVAFILDTLPRQIYLHVMLRVPYLYFSRVTRVFKDAEFSMPEIKRAALEAVRGGRYGGNANGKLSKKQKEINTQLKATWDSFIDSLLKEWKTLNLVSVFLLSAIVAMLQLESASPDPLIRYSALLSLLCASMSLLYGCMYIIRFGTMRQTHKAAEWAAEAQKSRTSICWNVWILLAMPAIWLSWSILWYIACVMSFIWQTGKEKTLWHDALWPRIILSVVLGLGVLYFILIMVTFRRYGDMMDRAWKERVIGWMTQDIAVGEPTVREVNPSNHMEGGWVHEPSKVQNKSSEPQVNSADQDPVVRQPEVLLADLVSESPQLSPQLIFGNTLPVGSPKDVELKLGDNTLCGTWKPWAFVNPQELYDVQSEEVALGANVAAWRHSGDAMSWPSGGGLDRVVDGSLVGQDGTSPVTASDSTPDTDKPPVDESGEDGGLRKAFRVIALLPTLTGEPCRMVSDEILHRYQYDAHLWGEFINDTLNAWNDKDASSDAERRSRVVRILQRWTEYFFLHTGNARVILCREDQKGMDNPCVEGEQLKDNDGLREGNAVSSDDGCPEGKGAEKCYVVYVIDHHHLEEDEDYLKALAHTLSDRPLPDHVERVEIVVDWSPVALDHDVSVWS